MVLFTPALSWALLLGLRLEGVEVTDKGYKAKSFKGVPIAIEWHSDGSVTLCKEIVEHIRVSGDISHLMPPPPGTIIFGPLPERRKGELHDPS